VSAALPIEGAGGTPPAPPRRGRRKLTRLRRFAHVGIVPVLLGWLVAPADPGAAILAGVVVALVVAVWLDRFAPARVRTALEASRALRILDLVLWNGALVLLALEVSLQVASRAVRSPLLTAPSAKARDLVQAYRFQPFATYLGMQTNAGGFHDTAWTVPKPPGVFRIVALGDSFNVGIVPYDENVLTLLERELSRRCGSPVEVANLGIASTGPREYLHVLNDEGRLLDPDLVLTCVFVGNDIGVVREGSHLRPGNWLALAVGSRLSRMFDEWRRRAPPVASTEQPKIGAPMSPERYLRMVVEDYLPTLGAAPPPSIERRWSSTLEVVERIGALAGAGRHAIAVYPCEPQVDPELLAQGCRAAGVDPSTIDLAGPGRRVAERFAPAGVPVCDLLPAFAARRAEGRAYEPNETHWNAHGNRIAAEALADWLEPLVRARLAR
jgi:hypothetical protein